MRRRWWRSLEIQARSASEGSPAEPRHVGYGSGPREIHPRLRFGLVSGGLADRSASPNPPHEPEILGRGKRRRGRLARKLLAPGNGRQSVRPGRDRTPAGSKSTTARWGRDVAPPRRSWRAIYGPASPPRTLANPTSIRLSARGRTYSASTWNPLASPT